MIETALVSGSNGFIGSHLVDRLQIDGFKVIPADRKGTFIPATYVFDLASYGNLFGQKDKEKIETANVTRLNSLLKQSYDYKHFLVTSTNSVKLPVSSDYAQSKLKAESIAREYSDKGYPVSVVRPFTVIGVGEPTQHLIPTLIRSCLYGDKMPFTSEPVHDFIDVKDVVSAYIAIANSKTPNGFIFEAGRGESISNQQVKELVEDIVGTRANTTPVDSLRSYDTDRWEADTTTLTRLGWSPLIPIRDSITQMIEQEIKNGRK